MISHDYKLIFIHIPKCAGRSICDMFNQRFDHFTARYYMKEYPKQWKTYKKFTIVRNPYERLVSMYHYIQEHRRHQYEEINFGHDFKSWIEANISIFNASFKRNSPEGQRGTDGDLGSPFWFSSQYRRISDEYSIPASGLKIFKFEDINTLAPYFMDITGKNIPFNNKSTHKHFLEYYDKETLRIVNNFNPLREDLSKLQYKHIHQIVTP